MNGLALCSGIGCLDLGLRIATGGRYRVVCHVEREAYASATLVARMEDQAMEPAPIWDDLESFDGGPWRGLVDVVTAGLPCQPYSLAGERKGDDDERALWPHFVRVVRECEPAAIFLENVPEFLDYLEPVWRELRAMGFRFAPPLLHTAAESGAIHIRKRLFVLAAHSDRFSVWQRAEWLAARPQGRLREPQGSEPGNAREPTADTKLSEWRPQHETRGASRRELLRGGQEGAAGTGIGDRAATDSDCELGDEGLEARALRERGSEVARGDRPIAHANGHGLAVEWSGWVFHRERQTLRHDTDRCGPGCRICGSPWEAESPIVRVDHGTPTRVVELRTIGNGVVPDVAASAWRELIKHVI